MPREPVSSQFYTQSWKLGPVKAQTAAKSLNQKVAKFSNNT